MADETLDQRLSQLIADGADWESAVDKVLAGCRGKHEMATLVAPLVGMRARHIERRITRSLERQVFDRPSADGASERRARGDMVAELVRSTFALPDGSYVTWGAATVEDHRARAGWQRRLAADVTADAERHELAADLIEAEGASCLDDIPDWSARLDVKAAA